MSINSIKAGTLPSTIETPSKGQKGEDSTFSDLVISLMAGGAVQVPPSVSGEGQTAATSRAKEEISVSGLTMGNSPIPSSIMSASAETNSTTATKANLTNTATTVNIGTLNPVTTIGNVATAISNTATAVSEPSTANNAAPDITVLPAHTAGTLNDTGAAAFASTSNALNNVTAPIYNEAKDAPPENTSIITASTYKALGDSVEGVSVETSTGNPASDSFSKEGISTFTNTSALYKNAHGASFTVLANQTIPSAAAAASEIMMQGQSSQIVSQLTQKSYDSLISTSEDSHELQIGTSSPKQDAIRGGISTASTTDTLVTVEGLKAPGVLQQQQDLKLKDESTRTQPPKIEEATSKAGTQTQKIEQAASQAGGQIKLIEPAKAAEPLTSTTPNTNDEIVFLNLLQPQLNQKGEEASIIEKLNTGFKDLIHKAFQDISYSTSDKIKSFQVRIMPEHLGAMIIKVSLDDTGLSARIMVDNRQVMDLLNNQLGDLRSSMTGQGLNLGSIDVGLQQNFQQNFLNERSTQFKKDLVESDITPVDTYLMSDTGNVLNVLA